MAKTRSRKKPPSFPRLDTHTSPAQTWFSRNGFVLRSGGRVEVLVGGTLVASFDEGDTGSRNVVLVLLTQDPKVCYEDLAQAFRISSETLRLIRHQYEAEGLEAIVARARGGSETKVSPSMRRRMEKLFAKGATISEVHRRFASEVCRATVGNVRQSWAVRCQPMQSREGEQQALPFSVEAQPPVTAPTTQELLGANATGAAVSPAPRAFSTVDQTSTPTEKQEPPAPIRAPSRDCSERSARLPREEPVIGSAEEAKGADEPIAAQEPSSQRGVHHAGALLMVAMAAALGLYERAQALRRKERSAERLRVVLDAAVIALSIGEKCVEGVRRLATSSAAALLLAVGAPSASWVRRVLGDYCQKGVAQKLHFNQAAALMQQARLRSEEGRPVVFYVDNHLRPYSGKHKVRWGWRMQDKRVLPGNTDYYVHDEDGRPVMRIAVPEHGSLTSFLLPIAAFLRLGLGKEPRILVAFDRGGSYPEAMAELRNAGIEFVTYERKPYRSPSHEEFDCRGKTVKLTDEDGGPPERIRTIDGLANLGEGRGRVRRLSLRLPDRHRLNLLAISEEDPAWLIEAMSGRWVQENGFKHGVERWGINQLDGRQVKHYAPETIIPNPARRQLDQKLEVQRTREGEARRQLARLKANDPTRAVLKEEIADALRRQAELEAQRPATPVHAALQDTELDGRLVYHTDDYKLLLDTIRVVLANAESQLAAEIAPFLRRPKEAKKALLNLFKATGDIRVSRTSITVAVDPAGTRNERAAFSKLLARVNRWKLVHPGDPKGRPMRFKVQNA